MVTGYVLVVTIQKYCPLCTGEWPLNYCQRQLDLLDLTVNICKYGPASLTVSLYVFYWLEFVCCSCRWRTVSYVGLWCDTYSCQQMSVTHSFFRMLLEKRQLRTNRDDAYTCIYISVSPSVLDLTDNGNLTFTGIRENWST